MEKRREELSKRTLYVYDLPEDLLGTLQLKSEGLSAETRVESESDGVASEEAAAGPGDGTVGNKACSLCGVKFATVDDQRSHVRSDFHAYNLKRKLKMQRPVSELEFEKLVEDLDESLSGSDSSDSSDEVDGSARKESVLSALLKKQAAISDPQSADEEALPHRRRGAGSPPLVWFSSSIFPEKTYLGVYRAVFSIEEQAQQDYVDALRGKQLAPQPAPKLQPHEDYTGSHVFLCMIGGGHFAAMIVALAPKQVKSSAHGLSSREATVLAHKTFHRYTTRRKQGGSQSSNDAAKGAAHSAGSSLRRYNEAALVDEVRALLTDWKNLIDTSSLLFIRATGVTSRKTLYGPYDGQVLKSNDPRIRGFPFSTRRATQSELMRSFVELTRIKIREIDFEAIAAAKAASAQQTASLPRKQTPSAIPKRSEEEETALLHTTQVQALIKRSRIPVLLSYLKSNSISPDFRFFPSDSAANYHTPTPLHLAASQNATPLVTALIVRAGASPLVQNADGRTPFELAGDRPTRDAFRVARSELGEGRWDWDAAQVPSAISLQEATERDQREKESAAKAEGLRRREAEERLKSEVPKAPTNKIRGVTLGNASSLTPEEKRREEARGLTPEAKARLEREKRARAAEERLTRMAGGR